MEAVHVEVTISTLLTVVMRVHTNDTSRLLLYPSERERSSGRAMVVP
jgi:hypothetical protein